MRDFFTNPAGYDIVISPWVMNHFYSVAGIVLFVWFSLIRLAYKIDFLRLGDRPFVRFCYWFLVVLISMALLGYTGFFASTSYFNGTHEVASALSPDGHHKATVLRRSWVEIFYDVVVESNDPTPPFSEHVPIFAQAIGSVGFGNNEPTEPAHIVWSANSRIVSLWFGNSPQFAYDFGREIVIDPAREPETFREMIAR